MNFIAFFKVFEIAYMPAILPWTFFSTLIQTSGLLKHFYINSDRDESKHISIAYFTILLYYMQILNNGYYLLY